MAKALASNGATVYILGRRQDKLEAAAKSIGKDTVKPIVCDVTSKNSLAAAANTVDQDVGYLNLLICNAGVSGPQTRSSLHEPDMTLEEFAQANWNVPMDDFTQTFAANTSAVWYTTMAFLGLLGAGNKKGNVAQLSQVIATSSIAGFNKVREVTFHVHFNGVISANLSLGQHGRFCLQSVKGCLHSPYQEPGGYIAKVEH